MTGDVEECADGAVGYDASVVLVVSGGGQTVVALFYEGSVVADFLDDCDVSVGCGGAGCSGGVVDDGADDGLVADFPPLVDPVSSPHFGVAWGVEGDVVGVTAGLLGDAPGGEGYAFAGECVGGVGGAGAAGVGGVAVGHVFPGVVITGVICIYRILVFCI